MTAPNRPGEHGFTLVELLVAMAAGVTVLFALSGILIALLDQSQRTFTRVDATRQARTALAQIENELHSACVSTTLPPIQTGSTATSLAFLSYTGAAVSPTPTWHVLALTGTSLTDTSYPVTAGQSAGYTPSGNGTSVTLLSNVAAQPGTDPFQYFRYTAFLAPDGSQYWTIPDGTTALPDGTVPPRSALADSGSGLSSDDARNTVEVLVNLLVGASSSSLSNPSIARSADPVTDAISLRLSTPPDELPATSGAVNLGPCQ